MVRPRKIKLINLKPEAVYFKPRGVPLSNLSEVELTLDELEAMRLSHIEKLSQLSSAKKMQIHQSTFHRTLARALGKVTDALVNGKSIRISGGDYKIAVNRIKGYGNCKCPSCGKIQSHKRGTPCAEINCSKCGINMIREF